MESKGSSEPLFQRAWYVCRLRDTILGQFYIRWQGLEIREEPVNISHICAGAPAGSHEHSISEGLREGLNGLRKTNQSSGENELDVRFFL